MFSRKRDYPETRFEHFLATAVASRYYFEQAAERGIRISKGRLSPSRAHVGRIIRDAATTMMRSQRGGNTSLGTLTLLVPLAVAAGMTMTRHRFSLSALRYNLKRIVRSTTEDDASSFYDAVSYAKPGGLGNVAAFDVRDPASKKQIVRLKLGLFHLFQLASKWDAVCLEWVTGYSTTFELGFPYFRKELTFSGDINEATVNTYLRILAETPDTLIARKAGIEMARRVSMRARKALALDGMRSNAGRRNWSA